MKQALHILRKDIRHLRYDIAIILVAAAAFTAAGILHAPAANVLLPVTWWFLIARVTHAEALPGYRQFWLTRPYQWQSLLAAKLLFLLLFVNVPLALADAMILHATGFSLWQQITGFLWTQLLLTTVFVLPAWAFAAVTAGLSEFLAATMVVVIVALARVLTSAWSHWGAPWFELEWMKTYVLVAQLAVGAAIIVVWQYARRRTGASRQLLGGTAAVLLVTGPLLPWKAAFSTQMRLSPGKFDASVVRVELDRKRKWLSRIYAAGGGQVVAELPLAISGLSREMELKPDGISLQVHSLDGQTWQSSEPAQSSFDFESGVLSLRMSMEKPFYERVKDRNMEIRGTLFFTLFQHKPGVSIPLNGRPVAVGRSVLCSAGPRFLRCDSAFRIPSDSITVRILRSGPVGPIPADAKPFHTVSYSPFPAEIGIDPLPRSYFALYTYTVEAATADIAERVAHLRRDFVFNQVRLADFGNKAAGFQAPNE